jgi:hypothetical protein
LALWQNTYDRGAPTANGGRWHLASVQRLINRLANDVDIVDTLSEAA